MVLCSFVYLTLGWVLGVEYGLTALVYSNVEYGAD